MSSIDAKKFKAVASSINVAFSGGSTLGMNNAGDTVVDLSELPVNDTLEKEIKEEKKMDEIYNEVKRIIELEGLNSEIAVKKSERGIGLVFRDDLLFDKGQAVVKPDVKKILYSLANILKEYNKNIRIEGHTDNIPIKNNYFNSNWELSTARAISVVKYYTEELPVNERISPNVFEVAGLSEHSPVAPNDTDENRQKNRRIEIIIIK